MQTAKRIAGKGLRGEDCSERIAGTGLQEDSSERIAGSGLQGEDCRERVAGRGWQMEECRTRIGNSKNKNRNSAWEGKRTLIVLGRASGPL